MSGKTKISFTLDDSDLAYFRSDLPSREAERAATVDRSKIEQGVKRLIT